MKATFYLFLLSLSFALTGCFGQFDYGLTSASDLGLHYQISGPDVVRARECTYFSVGVFDASGNPASPPAASLVGLDVAGLGAFYSDETCTTAITSITIPEATSAVGVYFESPLPGSATVDAGSAVSPITIVAATGGAGIPVMLAFTAGPLGFTAGNCSGPYTIEVQDDGGGPATVELETAVSLTGLGSATLMEDNGGSCGSPLSTLVIPQYGSSVSFFLKDNFAETLSLDADASTAGIFGEATRTVTVNPGAPSQLALLAGPSPFLAGDCTGPYTVISEDSLGNAVVPSSSLSVTIGGLSTSTTAYGPGCVSSISPTQTLSGASSFEFYLKDTRAEALSLKATSSIGSSPTVQVVSQAAPGSRITIVSGPPSGLLGSCVGPFQAQSTDLIGNASPVSLDTTLTIAGLDGGTWSPNSSCTAGVVKIPSGSSTTSFYVSPATTGTFNLSASGTDANNASYDALGSVSLLVASNQLVISANAGTTTIAEGPCAEFTVTSLDPSNNPLNQPSNLSVSLGGLGAGTVYSSLQNCAQNVSLANNTITIAQSTSSVSFYYKDAVLETNQLTATALDYSNTPLAVSIVSAPFRTAHGFSASVLDGGPVSLLPLSSGEVFVGGKIDAYDQNAVGKIALLTAAGTIDPSFSAPSAIGSVVQAMALSPDGTKVYVGTDQGIFRLNATTGALDTSFASGTGATSGKNVYAIAVDASGDVYIGGDFTTAGGQSNSRIAELDSTGTSVAAFQTNAGTGFDNTVYALALDSANGELYVGGQFTAYGSTTSLKSFAVINTAGQLVTGASLGSGNGFDGPVYSLLLDSTNSELYAGGQFTQYTSLGGTSTTSERGLCRLNLDGTLDTTFATTNQIATGGQVISIAFDGTNVYAAGNFTVSGAQYGVARFSKTTGTVDPSFPQGTGFPSAAAIAFALDNAHSGMLYVAGAFGNYNTQGVDRVARINTSNGGVDTTFTSGSGFNNDVYAVAPLTDGSGAVIVGGEFTSYNGTPVGMVAKINSDGTIDTAFASNVGTGFNDTVWAIAIDPTSGKILVGGEFTTYGGTATSAGIVRLNTNGTLDATFNSGKAGVSWSSGTAGVFALAFDFSGNLFAGGVFDHYNGTAAQNIVMIPASPGDGTADATFTSNVGSTFNAPVRALQIPADGTATVYVGGDFTAGIARLVATGATRGTASTTFLPGGGFNKTSYSVLSLTTDSSGNVYVVGGFTTYQGASIANGVAKLDSSANLDTTFNTNAGGAGSGFSCPSLGTYVHSITIANDGTGNLYVGGCIASYSSRTGLNGLVRLSSSGVFDATFASGIGTGADNLPFVLAPALDGSGNLYLGGELSSFNGEVTDTLARLTPSGAVY